jgi:hypothetical protein
VPAPLAHSGHVRKALDARMTEDGFVTTDLPVWLPQQDRMNYNFAGRSEQMGAVMSKTPAVR